MSQDTHGTGLPSEWIRRWSHLVEPAASVLDVACGHGRHARWFAGRGHRVTGVDRAEESLQSLRDLAAQGQVEPVCADIESGPWPLMLAGGVREFGAVVVTNYLWRPLFPVLLASLAPGGVLLYETFALGHASVGRPSRPDFLLRAGELLSVCADLRVVAFEDGFCTAPERFVQRIAAVRPAGDGNSAGQARRRYPLAP